MEKPKFTLLEQERYLDKEEPAMNKDDHDAERTDVPWQATLM
jgi:hypothetical protein